MKVNTPTETVLYTIEQAIKTYRKFCQINIGKKIKDITVDQTLTLILIHKYPKLNQKELASLVFKDYASMTRIIELLVKKGYLNRTMNEADRRRFKLVITTKGNKVIKELSPTIEYNRNTALAGIPDGDLLLLQNTLEKIIANCTS